MPLGLGASAQTLVGYAGPPILYLGRLGRSRCRGVWEVPTASDPLVYDIDLYGLPTASGDFNGNGDFPAVDVLHKWYSEADVTVRTDTSDTFLGSDSVPPAWPASDPGYSGYSSTLMVAVVKWHFTYTA